MMKFKLLVILAIAAVAAFGQGVLTLPDGNVSIGLGADGELGNCANSDCEGGGLAPGTPGLPAGANGGSLAGEPYGIYLASMNADSVTPGCFCEGWGASYNGSVTGNSSNDNGGVTNVSLVSFTPTGSCGVEYCSAVSITTIGNLQITQSYAPAPGAGGQWLFQDTVTIKNTGGTTDTNVQYARSTDWDIYPTSFAEVETLGGWPASDLVWSTNNGFCADDPLAIVSSCAAITTTSGSSWTDTNFVQNGVADQGSSFLFNFGSLAAGASTTFDIFYGAADDNTDALAALAAVGAQVYVLGYSNNGNNGANLASGTWMFAFTGVGGTSIGGTPEPASFVLVGSSLLGLGLLGLKRKKA
jgi:type IV pilus assembly protein PilY1